MKLNLTVMKDGLQSDVTEISTKSPNKLALFDAAYKT